MASVSSVVVAAALIVSACSPANRRAASGPAARPVRETGFLARSIALEGVEYRYQVYVPPDYRPSTAWPIVLALHGAGERGDDGRKQTEVGLGPAIRRHPDRYPAIVVFPQRASGANWQEFGATLALATLDESIAEFSVDRDRVYLTGLSMGGNGAWYLASRHPDRFAAVVVVCGFVRGGGAFPTITPLSGSDPFADLASRVSRTPVWIFHGADDPVVPADESRQMASALTAVGASVHYTEFPGVRHNAWDSAYNLPELPAWLLAQRRRPGRVMP